MLTPLSACRSETDWLSAADDDQQPAPHTAAQTAYSHAIITRELQQSVAVSIVLVGIDTSRRPAVRAVPLACVKEIPATDDSCEKCIALGA